MEMFPGWINSSTVWPEMLAGNLIRRIGGWSRERQIKSLNLILPTYDLLTSFPVYNMVMERDATRPFSSPARLQLEVLYGVPEILFAVFAEKSPIPYRRGERWDNVWRREVKQGLLSAQPDPPWPRGLAARIRTRQVQRVQGWRKGTDRQIRGWIWSANLKGCAPAQNSLADGLADRSAKLKSANLWKAAKIGIRQIYYQYFSIYNVHIVGKQQGHGCTDLGFNYVTTRRGYILMTMTVMMLWSTGNLPGETCWPGWETIMPDGPAPQLKDGEKPLIRVVHDESTFTPTQISLVSGPMGDSAASEVLRASTMVSDFIVERHGYLRDQQVHVCLLNHRVVDFRQW